jgi:hypothetical protein
VAGARSTRTIRSLTAIAALPHHTRSNESPGLLSRRRPGRPKGANSKKATTARVAVVGSTSDQRVPARKRARVEVHVGESVEAER